MLSHFLLDPELIFRIRILAKFLDPCGSGSTTLIVSILFFLCTVYNFIQFALREPWSLKFKKNEARAGPKIRLWLEPNTKALGGRGLIFTNQNSVILQAFIQGFGAGAAWSRGIWLEPELSLWPGSSSTLNICLIIHENYMKLNIIWCLF